MSRTQKDTVDYFPHYADASGGDTLTALEARFGNDGYAFWFKLLEKLCRSPGHYFDTNEGKAWAVFVARCHIEQDKALEIVALLVDMGAVDKDLWEVHRIIWTQNLVDNVADVYTNRRRPAPARPLVSPFKLLTPARTCPVCGVSMAGLRSDALYCSDNCRKKASRGDNVTDNVTDNFETTEKNGITTKDNGITTVKKAITTSQSKVEQRKEKNRKEKERTVVCFSPSLEEVTALFEQNISLKSASDNMKDELTRACKNYSSAWVADAIREAVNANQLSWRYVLGILNNWGKSGQSKG